MLEMSRPKILVKRENIEFLEKLEKLTASKSKLVEQRIVWKITFISNSGNLSSRINMVLCKSHINDDN